ncbi:MAG TPA: ABC transporter permease [Anaerolineaceae bacterium]|nr:ABC transporter permease [Anaerolineaceae bacterium]
MQSNLLPVFLALREVWRNKGRFLLVGLVISLITILVLFTAGLGEGLGNGNKEYISKLDGQLLVYQQKSDFVIPASRLPVSIITSIRRVEGVADAGLIATSNAAIILSDKPLPLKVSMLGVEPGRPGEPPAVQGRQFSGDLANEVIIDRSVAVRSSIQLNDTITIRVTQGTQDEFYTLRVVGISNGQQYSLQPAIFVPYFTWDRIRSKSEAEINGSDYTTNTIIVKLENPGETALAKERLLAQIDNIEVASIQQAIEAVPGYSAQQGTISTQGIFTLFIGVLVIGGFFQIQVLQKVPQIGVLKAIGASNFVVGLAVIAQIISITVIGVGLGTAITLGFARFFPPTVPIVFNGQQTLIAIISLLLIGPIGGLLSVRYAIKIEPLKALGLS